MKYKQCLLSILYWNITLIYDMCNDDIHIWWQCNVMKICKLCSNETDIVCN